MNLFYRIFSPTPKPMKTCFRCGATGVPFHKDSSTKDGWSASCAECRNKRQRKVRIHPKEEKIQTTKVSIAQEINDQLDDLCGVTSQEDLKAFARVHDRLLKHFGRMYWMKVEADGRAEIRAYGEHSESFKGKNIEETIKLVLG